MGKTVTTASWIGKAAYEIIQITGESGASANRTARILADQLLDYGVDLARIDPRDYARKHFDMPKTSPVLGDGEIVATTLSIDACEEDPDALHFMIHGANGCYADRGMTWGFAIAVRDAYHGRSMVNGSGASIRPVKGHVLIQLPATAIRHGVTIALKRDQINEFRKACLKASDTKRPVTFAVVDAVWGDEPTSPVVRARIAERSRLAA